MNGNEENRAGRTQSEEAFSAPISVSQSVSVCMLYGRMMIDCESLLNELFLSVCMLYGRQVQTFVTGCFDQP